MFCAIDLRTNKTIISINLNENNYEHYQTYMNNKINDDEKIIEILTSQNIYENNYKDSYNNTLKFKCIDYTCNDNNIIFVNGRKITPHFRHSKKSYNCSAIRNFKIMNNPFNLNWFYLFNYKYRKPYWFNSNLEEISNDDICIIIRYSHQK